MQLRKKFIVSACVGIMAQGAFLLFPKATADFFSIFRGTPLILLGLILILPALYTGNANWHAGVENRGGDTAGTFLVFFYLSFFLLSLFDLITDNAPHRRFSEAFRLAFRTAFRAALAGAALMLLASSVGFLFIKRSDLEWRWMRIALIAAIVIGFVYSGTGAFFAGLVEHLRGDTEKEKAEGEIS